MRLWKNFNRLWIFILIGGCVAYTPPSNFTYREIATPQFTLASWQKIDNPGSVLTIYIEGDGYAFNYEGKASRDPTPRSSTLRKIAFRDRGSNIVYLARPCQYVMSKNCQKKDWTTGRFSQNIINAETEAVRHLLKQTGSRDVILVGYSGGAMIAALIAVQNPDIRVKKLITIAGLLEHRNWAEYHHVPPLNDSLDLNEYQKDFVKIPQIHFLGNKDKIIPKNLSPVADMAIIINGAAHASGWESLDLSEYK